MLYISKQAESQNFLPIGNSSHQIFGFFSTLGCSDIKVFNLPFQAVPSRPSKFSDGENQFVKKEIVKLLQNRSLLNVQTPVTGFILICL